VGVSVWDPVCSYVCLCVAMCTFSSYVLLCVAMCVYVLLCDAICCYVLLCVAMCVQDIPLSRTQFKHSAVTQVAGESSPLSLVSC